MSEFSILTFSIPAAMALCVTPFMVRHSQGMLYALVMLATIAGVSIVHAHLSPVPVPLVTPLLVGFLGAVIGTALALGAPRLGALVSKWRHR